MKTKIHKTGKGNMMTMQMYEIKYLVVGGKVDFIMIYAGSVSDAIEQFTTMEIDIGGIIFNYSKYSVISINPTNK